MLQLRETARSTRKNCKLIDQTTLIAFDYEAERGSGRQSDPSEADFVTSGLNFHLGRLISREMSTSVVDVRNFLTIF